MKKLVIAFFTLGFVMANAHAQEKVEIPQQKEVISNELTKVDCMALRLIALEEIIQDSQIETDQSIKNLNQKTQEICDQQGQCEQRLNEIESKTNNMPFEVAQAMDQLNQSKKRSRKQSAINYGYGAGPLLSTNSSRKQPTDSKHGNGESLINKRLTAVNILYRQQKCDKKLEDLNDKIFEIQASVE